jgi:thymidylate synthase
MGALTVCSIKAFDIGDAWYQCLSKVLEIGREYEITSGSYAGEEGKSQKRKEFDYIVVQITNPGNRPLAPVVPEGMVPPTNDAYIEEYALKYLHTDQKQANEDYTYGQRLNNPMASLADEPDLISRLKMKNVNQIEEVIRRYKKDFANKKGYGTNQCTMSIEMPMDILLKDPPCLRIIDTRVREDDNCETGFKLHFMVYFRSWDLVGGFPANLGGLQLLKEHMRREIGVDDGEIIAASKGLHIYEQSWGYANARCHKKIDKKEE